MMIFMVTLIIMIIITSVIAVLVVLFFCLNSRHVRMAAIGQTFRFTMMISFLDCAVSCALE